MRRSLALALFDAVYVDMVHQRIQEYRPKAAFLRLLTTLGGVVSGDPDGDRSPHLPSFVSTRLVA